MSLALLLNWRLWAVTALLIFTASTHWAMYKRGERAIQADWNAEKVELARLSIQLTKQVAKTSAELQANTDHSNEVLHAQIDRIASERNRLAGELRKRPERPAEGGVPAAAGDGARQPSCTGVGLYRDDGQFLVGFASDRAILQAGLKSCYAQYEAARTKLEALTEK